MAGFWTGLFVGGLLGSRGRQQPYDPWWDTEDGQQQAYLQNVARMSDAERRDLFASEAREAERDRQRAQEFEWWWVQATRDQRRAAHLWRWRAELNHAVDQAWAYRNVLRERVTEIERQPDVLPMWQYRTQLRENGVDDRLAQAINDVDVNEGFLRSAIQEILLMHDYLDAAGPPPPTRDNLPVILALPRQAVGADVVASLPASTS